MDLDLSMQQKKKIISRLPQASKCLKLNSHILKIFAASLTTFLCHLWEHLWEMAFVLLAVLVDTVMSKFSQVNLTKLVKNNRFLGFSLIPVQNKN